MVNTPPVYIYIVAVFIITFVSSLYQFRQFLIDPFLMTEITIMSAGLSTVIGFTLYHAVNTLNKLYWSDELSPPS
jgi:hypothetical protein